MSTSPEFKIANGVLVKYKGPGGVVTIPDGVTSVGEKAFYRCGSVTEVIIPEGVTEICAEAFEKCANLKNVILPEMLREIGTKAFAESGLETITIPEGITTVGAHLFESCKNLQYVNLPSSMEELSEGMFSQCWSLENVIIPDELVAIGKSAFYDCGRLKTIRIPKSMKVIGAGAFSECRNLTGLHIDDVESWCRIRLASHPLYESSLRGRWRNAQDGKLYVKGELVSEVQIPAGMTVIPGGLFCNCTNIKSVRIPASVKKIRTSAFASCKLKEVHIESLEAWCQTTFLEGLNAFTYNPVAYADLYLNDELVTDLEIPTGVTTIPERAFYGCQSLKSVTIPESVREIGNHAFSCCGNLKTIKLPDHLQSIGFMTFRECHKLKTVNFPQSLEAIGKAAFEHCNSFSQIELPDGLKLIGDSAFAYCACTEVEIPETVKAIGDHAFYACEKLKHVTMHKGLLRIGEWAFRHCERLTEAEIPEGTQSIGNMAFADCSVLEHVVIPSSVTEVGEEVFENCKLAITIPDWSAIATDLFSKAEITSIHTDDISSVPTKKKPLAALGFLQEENKDLDSDRAKTHMSYIKRNSGKLCPVVFENPPALYFMCEHLLIAAKDYDLFAREAEQRKDVELKALLMSYQNRLGGAAVAEARRKKEQEKDEYQDKLTNHALDWAEKGIEGMTFVVTGDLSSWRSREELKAHLEEYGAKLGSGISKKTDYLVTNYPESATEKIEKARALGVEVLSEEEMNFIVGRKFRDEKEITVPAWIKRIEKGAFENCVILEIVNLHSNIERIEERAFSNCRNLMEVVIPDSVKKLGPFAFMNCPRLERIKIPAGVSQLGYGAFESCVSLKNIEIPDSVAEIGGHAFYNCSSLTEVRLPEGIQVLESALFKYCNRLKDIRIPSSVKVIGYEAFSGCKSLNSLSLPKGIERIERDAFSKTQVFENVTNWADDAFYLGHCLIKVKTSLTGDYTIKPRTTCIADGAFSDCLCLKNVTIPESVLYVGGSAFSNCKNLETVRIQGSLKKVAERAFFNCGYLTFETDDPKNEILIKQNDFRIIESVLIYYYGTGGDVIVPENTTAIRSAFGGCTELKNLTIPDSVRSISETFKDSPNLTIYARKGSYAVQFAGRHGIPVSKIE